MDPILNIREPLHGFALVLTVHAPTPLTPSTPYPLIETLRAEAIPMSPPATRHCRVSLIKSSVVALAVLNRVALGGEL